MTIFHAQSSVKKVLRKIIIHAKSCDRLHVYGWYENVNCTHNKWTILLITSIFYSFITVISCTSESYCVRHLSSVPGVFSPSCFFDAIILLYEVGYGYHASLLRDPSKMQNKRGLFDLRKRTTLGVSPWDLYRMRHVSFSYSRLLPAFVWVVYSHTLP